MMNFQKEMDNLILKNKENNIVPTLLLHACCAPCSSYVLEYLSDYFKITVFYYNPNISPESEYKYRLEEEKRLISQLNTKYPVSIIDSEYNPNTFFSVVKGLEKEVEGGERCKVCFKLRLEETAKLCKEQGFDYFATTLTISPLKNANNINAIGSDLAQKYQVNYLPSDFKKKNGYKRSTELSKQFNLYRQNFCGCVFSKVMKEEM